MSLFEQEITACKKCYLCSCLPYDTKPIHGRGNINADTMVIIKKPCKDAMLMQKVVDHREKKVLLYILEKIEVNQNDIYITPAVKCLPTNKVGDVRTCADFYLQKEIDAVNPKEILIFGLQEKDKVKINHKYVVYLPSLETLYIRGNKYTQKTIETINMLRDKILGDKAEQSLLEHLINRGLDAKLNKDMSKKYDYDIYCEGTDLTFEVKNDIMSEKTGNVAIEYENSKKKAPSGIGATKAKYWVHSIKGEMYICKVEDLKKFMEEETPLKKIKSGGDKNSNMFIYKIEHIRKVMNKLDNGYIL